MLNLWDVSGIGAKKTTSFHRDIYWSKQRIWGKYATRHTTWTDQRKAARRCWWEQQVEDVASTLTIESFFTPQTQYSVHHMGDQGIDTHRMTKTQLQGDIFCINVPHSCPVDNSRHRRSCWAEWLSNVWFVMLLVLRWYRSCRKFWMSQLLFWVMLDHIW